VVRVFARDQILSRATPQATSQPSSAQFCSRVTRDETQLAGTAA